MLQVPYWDSPTGLGPFLRLTNTYDDPMPAASSEFAALSVHTATHIDAPSHFSRGHFDKGLGIESLDLGTLNGTSGGGRGKWGCLEE